MPPIHISGSIISHKGGKVKEKMAFVSQTLSCPKKIKLFFKKGLTKEIKCGIISKYEKNVYVPLAQLDRVFGYEPKGRGFESLKARHEKPCKR